MSTALDAGTPETAARSRWRALDGLALLGPYLGLLVVVAIFSYLLWERDQLDRFLSLSNLKLVTVHAAIVAAVAVGMTLIMISGGIDLSVGYVVSLVTVVTVLVYGWPRRPWLAGTASLWAMAAGIGTGGLAGLGNGPDRHQAQDRAIRRHAGHDGRGPRAGADAVRGSACRSPTPWSRRPGCPGSGR